MHKVGANYDVYNFTWFLSCKLKFVSAPVLNFVININ